MATKLELEKAYHWCNRQAWQMQSRIANQDYVDAIDLGVSSLSFLHQSITYQRRYLQVSNPTTEIVDQVLWYAPCLFRNGAIAQVDSFYKNGTKTERDALPLMPQKLQGARELSARCIELWQELSEKPDALVSAGRTDSRGARILQFWHSANLVYLITANAAPGYAKITDFNRRASGKCSKCGAMRLGTIPALAEHAACTACQRMTDFAILNRRAEG